MYKYYLNHEGIKKYCRESRKKLSFYFTKNNRLINYKGINLSLSLLKN